MEVPSPRPHRSRRVVAGAAVAACLVLGASTSPASAGPTVCAPGDGIHFTNRSARDAVVGIPGENGGSGMVEVRYGCGRGPQKLLPPTPHPGDRMGAAVASGYIDGDGFDDLAVGLPGLDVAGRPDAGGVAIYRGGPTGLTYVRTITQSTAGVPGTTQVGAQFGAALAIAGYEPDGTLLLRIGEPGHDVGSIDAAGGYVDLVSVGGVVSVDQTREVTLATAGVGASPGPGDRLGAALSIRSVGAPGRTVDGQVGAGAVLFPAARVLVTQATAGLVGVPEAGDHFGAAVSGQWIGVPGESVGTLAGAGMVERWGIDASARVALTQNSAGVSGTAEAGDHFGAALAELGVIVDDTEFLPTELLIGAPGEDDSSGVDVGLVSALGEYDDPDGGPYALTGGLGSLHPATPQKGAGFGAVLARNGSSTVQVGAPYASGGRVTIFADTGGRGAPAKRTATWQQVTGTPEKGDAYGSAFADGSF